jgi:two-component system OmpR family response regulator
MRGATGSRNLSRMLPLDRPRTQRVHLTAVLYVDDEPDIREIAAMALGLIDGLGVSTCASGEQALKAMSISKPQLVLLDVMMPTMDGPATLCSMRKDPSLKAIPVIFVTAKAMPKEVAQFRDLGAAGVIAKPFDPMKLGEQVLALWEGLPNH